MDRLERVKVDRLGRVKPGGSERPSGSRDDDLGFDYTHSMH